MEYSKRQASLNNIQFELKLEKMYSLSKDTKIKGLEDLVLKLGLNPKYVKVTEEIIKSRNAYIQALRMELKLPTTEHPQAQEVTQMEK